MGINEIVSMVANIVLSLVGIVTMVTGIVAARTYYKQKRDEKKTAKINLYQEILDIEETVEFYKLQIGADNRISNSTLLVNKDVLLENQWEKHKTLLINLFSKEEYKKMQKFYDSACRVQKLLDTIVENYKSNLQDKDLALQIFMNKKIYDIQKGLTDVPQWFLSSKEQIEIKKDEIKALEIKRWNEVNKAIRVIYNDISAQDLLFMPRVPMEEMVTCLKKFERISDKDFIEKIS
ncbi:MAG: hypothetical protein R3Y32_05210 [Bacillota bacterium]